MFPSLPHCAARGATARRYRRLPVRGTLRSTRTQGKAPWPAGGRRAGQTRRQFVGSRTALGGPITLGVGVEGRAAIDPRGLTKAAGPPRFIRSAIPIFPDSLSALGAVRTGDAESLPGGRHDK